MDLDCKLDMSSIRDRYSYAIPLEKMDAITIAEGTMEVVVHTHRHPLELLSNQESVFIGKVRIMLPTKY